MKISNRLYTKVKIKRTIIICVLYNNIFYNIVLLVDSFKSIGMLWETETIHNMVNEYPEIVLNQMFMISILLI